MSMRVIPEEAGPLAISDGNTHLVLEPLARMHVDEYVVAVSLRRHIHPVVMQVRWIIGENIVEGDPLCRACRNGSS